MPKTIAELTAFMDQLTKALDAIVEGVALNAEDEAAELLAQFNQLVPECDERLQFCTALLARGLREEALGYEADDPPLLETATLLDLSARPQWGSWLAAMRQHGFPEPVVPRDQAAREIRTAQTEVHALMPLLDRMRRGNLAGDPLPARIQTLRLLRAKDPNNEAWFECLRSHEKQRLMEIDTAVKDAVAHKNETMLEALITELRGEWLEPRSDRVVALATNAHRRLMTERLDRDLVEASVALDAAWVARDRDAARQIRERWNRLTADRGAFTVDDQQLARAASPLEWIASHDRLESLVSEVASALDARPDPPQARQEWVLRLSRMRDECEDLAERLHGELEIEPLERLRKRVARIEEDWRAEQAARDKLKYLIVAVVSLAVMGMVATAVSVVRHNDRVATAIAELTALGDRVRAGEFDPDKVPIPHLAEPVLADPAVAAEIRELDAAMANERDRIGQLAEGQARLTEMLDALAAVGHLSNLQAWPEPFASATRLVAKMTGDSLPRSEREKASLEKQEGLLQNAVRRFVRDGDDTLKTRVADLQDRLAALAERAASMDGDLEGELDSLDQAVASIERDVNALRLLATDQAAPGAVGPFANARKVSDGALTPLEQQGGIIRTAAAIRQTIDERRRVTAAERRLDECLGDWNRYADALKAAASEFPQSATARDYRECARDQPIWLAIAQWNAFAATIRPYDTLSPDQAAVEFTKLDDLAPAAEKLKFVSRFLKQVLPFVRAFKDRKPDDVRRQLLDWVNREWLGEIEWVIRADAADGSLMTYYCVVEPVRPIPPEQTLRFKYQRMMKVGGNWPNPVPGPELTAFTISQSPQRILANELESNCVDTITNGQGGFPLDRALVDAVSRTLAAKEVEPCIRLLTLRKLVLTGRDISPLFQSRDVTDNLIRELDDGNGGVPDIAIDAVGEFLDPNRRRNPDYQRVRKTAERTLTNAALIAARLAENAAAVRERLSNQTVPSLLCVGRLGRDAQGMLTLVAHPKITMPSAENLIVIEPNGSNTTIGTIDASGRHRLETLTLVTGTPVFVWARK